MQYTPVIGYLGGKRSYTKMMEKHHMIPEQIDHYVEPFVGGAAILAHINNTRDVKTNHINDIDKHLMNFYKYLKKDPAAFTRKYVELNGTREEFNRQIDILNKTYTGLPAAIAYRFVKAHAFGSSITRTPEGKIRASYHPSFHRDKNRATNVMTSFGDLLQKTKLTNTTYTKLNIPSRPNTFVFIDPPYDILETRAYINHTTISVQDLVEYCNKLDKAGIKFLLTYNYRPEMRELFAKYKIKVAKFNLHARRKIGDAQNTRKEIFIYNN